MVAVFAALCGSLLRRKTGSGSDPNEAPDLAPPPPHLPTPSPTTTPSSSPPPRLQGTEDCSKDDGKNAGNSEKEQQGQGYLLPLPPAMTSRHSLSHSHSNINHLPRSTSSIQKLKSSLSLTTVLRSLSTRIAVNGNNDDEAESVRHHIGQGGWSKLKKKHEKLKPDDSLWTKTIILGEKCKVPEDEESVFYDNKGKRIPSFRP